MYFPFITFYKYLLIAYIIDIKFFEIFLKNKIFLNINFDKYIFPKS